MRVTDKSIHEVADVGFSEVQELPASGGCRYQDLIISDDRGNTLTITLFLKQGCNGFVAGVDPIDHTIAPCDRPYSTKEGLHA